jgi:hypothetical protein
MAGRIDGDRGDRVEPQQAEVGQVVARERLAAQVRVDEANAAQPARTAAEPPEIRQHDLRGVADHDVLDRAAAVDQHADLAMQAGGERAELRRQFGGHDVGRRDAAPVQAFQRLDLARLQAVGVPGYVF